MCMLCTCNTLESIDMQNVPTQEKIAVTFNILPSQHYILEPISLSPNLTGPFAIIIEQALLNTLREFCHCKWNTSIISVILEPEA